MVGITSYGAYIPLWRLSRDAISKGSAGEKAICNYDEDSVTMAVASAVDCLNSIDRDSVDGLFFASTTSPYIEKMASTIIAMGVDLRRNIITADFAHSLRAGTAALKAALDAVKAGSAKNVLVTAADCRLGVPGSSFEQNWGDGSGAVLVGSENVVAEVKDVFSVSDEIIDIWKAEGDEFIRSWEERFTSTHGYLAVTAEAINGLLKKTGLSPKDFKKLVVYSPDGRRISELAKSVGFDVKTQVQDPLVNNVGCTGTAMPIMLLVAALEEAKPGDRFLLASYGNGADAFVIEVTENIGKVKSRGVKGHLNSKFVTNDYKQYLYWRGLLPSERRKETVAFISAPAIWRERDANLRLRGVKCKVCGTVQYPPQRVCTKCHAKDQFEPYRFSDKKATVFTYSADYFTFPNLDKSMVTATIDFEGGGRMLCYMTDKGNTELRVGMPVEMSFRKIIVKDGIHNYFWKCIPPRT